ncbi:histidine--tRNA ligase [Buchnera aphidicola]|uniref:histidine--tRNA ligase n=1 Tax=Buchnera aphidicola TaxID=9 RepID=UPI003464C7E9
MDKKISSVRGMHDYLPEELKLWTKVENILKEILNSYCYEEIRLPILEKTNIFKRAIGNVTDVVQKEMYSFNDRKGNSLTLRPEGTVGCVRAIIENNLFRKKKQKFWYLGPMFRYERPQKGRHRQFYQLGVEVFGLKSENIDLEIILLINRIWKNLGIHLHVKLEINSIGSRSDRLEYQKSLLFFLEKNKKFLDEDSKKRLYTNPFRILDSKNPNLQKILKNAPLLNNYINCSAINHFNNLCNMMNLYGIKYVHNTNLVRGLDYYNNTVFEWKTNQIGTQNTICAGGRYDSLVEELGGNKTSAIGFAIGIERLILLIKSLKIMSSKEREIDVYIIFIGESSKIQAIKLSEDIRSIYPKLRVFVNFISCNLSKKFKHAVESLAKIAILIGTDEIKKSCFLLKDLKNKQEYFLKKNELILKIKQFF